MSFQVFFGEIPASGAPVANFTGTPLSGAAPLSVVFTDSSTSTPTSWHWEKNDGSGWVDFAGNPTDQNPTESFAAGTWSVRLTATNASGSDTKTRTNYIFSGCYSDLVDGGLADCGLINCGLAG